MLLDANVLITNGLRQHCSVVSTICHHRLEIEEMIILGAQNLNTTGSRPLYLPILSSVLVESLNGEPVYSLVALAMKGTTSSSKCGDPVAVDATV